MIVWSRALCSPTLADARWVPEQEQDPCCIKPLRFGGLQVFVTTVSLDHCHQNREIRIGRGVCMCYVESVINENLSSFVECLFFIF